MNKQSLLNAAAVIALAMTLSVACNKKKDKAGVPAGAVETQSEKTSSEILNEVFRQIEGKYDASDLTLANQIKKIDLKTERTNVAGPQGGINDGPATITVWLDMGGVSPFSFTADGLVWRDLGSSVVTLDQVTGPAPEGMNVKIKCLDAGCTSTGILVTQYPSKSSGYTADNNGKAVFAGYIFENNKGDRELSVSVGSTLDWDQVANLEPAVEPAVEQK